MLSQVYILKLKAFHLFILEGVKQTISQQLQQFKQFWKLKQFD